MGTFDYVSGETERCDVIKNRICKWRTAATIRDLKTLEMRTRAFET